MNIQRFFEDRREGVHEYATALGYRLIGFSAQVCRCGEHTIVNMRVVRHTSLAIHSEIPVTAIVDKPIDAELSEDEVAFLQQRVNDFLTLMMIADELEDFIWEMMNTDDFFGNARGDIH